MRLKLWSIIDTGYLWAVIGHELIPFEEKKKQAVVRFNPGTGGPHGKYVLGDSWQAKMLGEWLIEAAKVMENDERRRKRA